MRVLQSNSAKVVISIVGGGLIVFLLLAIIVSFASSSKRQQPGSPVPINQELITVDSGESEGKNSIKDLVQLDVEINPAEAATFSLNPSPLENGAYIKGTDVNIDVIPTKGWKIDRWAGLLSAVGEDTAQVNLSSSQTVAVSLIRKSTGEADITPSRAESGSGPHLQTKTPTPDSRVLTPTPFFCFVAGTPVLTPNGYVAIEELRKGDTVLSYDHGFQIRIGANLSPLVEANLTAVGSRTIDGLILVELADGTTIRVTREHPFYAPDETRYKPIGEFKIGELLTRVGPGGKRGTVMITGTKAVQGEFTVYNLSVEGTHQNYVAAGLLVHNKTQVPTKGYRLFINGSQVRFGFTSIGIGGKGILQVDAPKNHGYQPDTYTAGSVVGLNVSAHAPGSQVKWSGVDSYTGTAASVDMVGDRYIDVDIIEPPPEGKACIYKPGAAEWSIDWYEATDRDSWGKKLGSETRSPAEFWFIFGAWSGGSLYNGRLREIGFEATMDVISQDDDFIEVSMSADDSFQLWVDGNLVMNKWKTHSSHNELTWTESVELGKGAHEFKVLYWQGPGGASFKFKTDQRILSWIEASGCEGVQNDLPDERYFVYRSASESLDTISSKFQISLNDLKEINQISDPNTISTGELFLLPGAAEIENRKVILIQGIGSSSSDDAYANGGDFGGHRSRLLRYFQDYQTGNTKLPNNNVWLEKEDVIGFSYSDRYWDVVEEKTVRGQGYLTNHLAVADYKGSDTCPGVHEAAQKLNFLINNLTSQEPDVQIDLIAHSMGGLVAAYWVSNQDSDYLKQHFRSVTTLDSPLLDGFPITSKLLSGCRSYDQATKDLFSNSDVLKKINQYENTTHRIPFFHINSTNIGDTLPRGKNLGQPCGGVNSSVWSAFFGVVASIVTGGLAAPVALSAGAGYILGDASEHSCVWTSPGSHALIAKNVIFNKELTLPVKNWAEEHYAAGIKYYYDQNYEMAEKEFTTAISFNPDVAGYYALRGASQHKRGQYLQAVGDFDNAIRLAPSVAESYALRGRSNYRREEYQSAVFDFEEATRLAPNKAIYFADLGVAHYKLDHFESAITGYDQAIKIAPEESEYYRLRGTAYRELSLYEKAMADLNKSIEITPDRSLPYVSRGLTYYRLGQYQLSIGDYDKSLQLNPDEARAYEGKGDAFRKLGQSIKANDAYATACNIDNAYCSYIPVPMPSPTPWPTGVPATTQEASAAATLDIDVNGDSLQFNLSEMSADAGTEVVVNFNNSSSINSHNWTLVENGTKDAVAADGVGSGPANNWLPEGDSRILGNTILLGPGQNGTATFTAPSAGTYQFVCTFPGHNFTMFGDFTVTPVSTAVPAAIPHPYGTGKLGIYLADYRDATIRGQLLTQEPIPNSAADAWGLQSGDVITLINDEPVETAGQLSGLFAGFSGGDVVKVRFIRDYNLYEGEVSLGAYHYQTVGTGEEQFLDYSLLPGETLAYHYLERDGNAMDFSVIGPDGDSVVGLVLDDKSTGQFQASQSGTYRMRFGNQSAWLDTKEIDLWYRITP